MSTPDRATVVRDLSQLHGELQAARAMDSPNREAIVRQKIDRKLDELWRCVDPRDTASEQEWGKAG